MSNLSKRSIDVRYFLFICDALNSNITALSWILDFKGERNLNGVKLSWKKIKFYFLAKI
jgi:hypothetical protein